MKYPEVSSTSSSTPLSVFSTTSPPSSSSLSLLPASAHTPVRTLSPSERASPQAAGHEEACAVLLRAVPNRAAALLVTASGDTAFDLLRTQV
jgi:hypothetical protein